jgi:hypothetical protein
VPRSLLQSEVSAGPSVTARLLDRGSSGPDDQRHREDQSPTTSRAPGGERVDAGLLAVVTVTLGPPTRPRTGARKAGDLVLVGSIGPSVAVPRLVRAGLSRIR